MLVLDIKSIVHLLYEVILETFKDTNKPPGWFWRLEEFVKNYLTAYFRSWIYIAANEKERFMHLQEKAQSTVHLKILDEDEVTNDFLKALKERNLYFSRIFGRLDEMIQCFPYLKWDLFPCAYRLKTDPVFAKSFDSKVYDNLGCVEIHNQAWRAAVYELRYREGSLSRESRHWLNFAIHEKRGAYEELIKSYRLSVSPHLYGIVDKEDILQDLLPERAHRLKQMNRSETRQLDENKDFTYISNRFNSRVKNIFKQQQRERKKFIPLDGKQEDGKVPTIEIVRANPVNVMTGPLELGKDLTHSQKQQIITLFERQKKTTPQAWKKCTPETGLRIIEYMVVNGMYLEHGDKKEIAEDLRLAPSTVGLYVGTKNEKGFINQVAEELVEILHRR